MFKAMDVEAKPYAGNQWDQPGHDDGIHFGSEWGTPAVGEEEAQAKPGWHWPDWLVDFILPEVPPGNLDEKEYGIPKRFAELIIYFGLLTYTMVSGWLAFIQYRDTRRDALREPSNKPSASALGPPLQYIWLPSLVLLAVYNVVGPLPRALGDLLCVKPGGFYFYSLRENDCLNPNFARTFMLLLTTLATFIQFGVFYLSFFTEVIEKGVKVPAAILAIVPALFDLGSVVGINDAPGQAGDAGNLGNPGNAGNMRSLVSEALYSDPNEGGSKRWAARQKLFVRIMFAKMVLWIMFGVFLTIAYVMTSNFGVQWRA